MAYNDYGVVGYAYKATEYCPSCVIRTLLNEQGLEGHGLSHVNEDALDLMARFQGVNMGDETTYDSDDWPKVVLGYQAEDHESYCDRCHGSLTDTDVIDRSWMSA